MSMTTIGKDLPCDPASTRRPPVSGLGGVKLATEGGGGVGPQAPSTAATTGMTTTTQSAPDVAPNFSSARYPAAGPVPKRRKNSANRRRKAAAARAAAHNDDTAGLACGAALDDIVKRAASGPAPSGTSSVSSVAKGGPGRTKKSRQERRRRTAELVHQYKQRLLDEVMFPSDMVAIAPAISAVMARPTSNTIPSPAVSRPSNPVRGTTPPAKVCREVPTAARGLDLSEKGSSRPSEQCEVGLMTVCRGGTHSKAGAQAPETQNKIGPPERAVGEAPVAPETRAHPRPGTSKGKGIGKGRRVEGHGVAPATSKVAQNTKENVAGGENARSAKRQRSTDLVSPSTAAAEKKVRLSGGTAAACASASAGHTKTVGNGAEERHVSYARAVKSHLRVIVLDRSGPNMDEVRGIALRTALEDCHMRHFLANQDDPDSCGPVFRSMPRVDRGGLRMEPSDDFSLSWLTSTVESLPPLWPGSTGYKVVPIGQMPRYVTGRVFAPDWSGDANTLKAYLGHTNKRVGISVGNWPIFAHETSHGITEHQTDHSIVFGIPVEEVDLLKNVDCRLGYKTASVHVDIRKPRAGDVRAAADGPGSSVTDVPTQGNCDGEWEVSQDDIDRLLYVDDEGAEISGGISGLNLSSPAPSMDVERSVASPGSSHSQSQ